MQILNQKKSIHANITKLKTKNRLILHGKYTIFYFIIIISYALVNLITNNDGIGICILIFLHFTFDSIWILVDSHLKKNRTSIMFLHHLISLLIIIGLIYYKPWRMLVNYAQLVELSALITFIMKFYKLPKNLYLKFHKLNILFWITFRWAIPLYALFYWTNWWDLSIHHIFPVIALFLLSASLIIPQIYWTMILHKRNWYVNYGESI